MSESAPYCYEYPRPCVTVDAVVFNLEITEVLLIQRKNEPGKGQWALPGGFIEIDEELEESVARELMEETGIDCPGPWKQVGAYGRVDRDPRGRVIMIAFTTLLNKDKNCLEAGDDAQDARWFSLKEIPEMAFDHPDVVKNALKLQKPDN